MKKKLIFRFIGIGTFHMILYLYVVPFVLYPRFGHNGFLFAGIVAVMVSMLVIGTIFIGRNNKGDKSK